MTGVSVILGWLVPEVLYVDVLLQVPTSRLLIDSAGGSFHFSSACQRVSAVSLMDVQWQTLLQVAPFSSLGFWFCIFVDAFFTEWRSYSLDWLVLSVVSHAVFDHFLICRTCGHQFLG